MSSAHVGAVRLERGPGVVTARATLTLGGEAKELFWRVRGADVVAAPEAFFCAALQPAMSRGWPVEVEQGLSARLLKNVSELQGLYCCFDSQVKRVPVRAEPVVTQRNAKGVGLFFSGGVDGFHGLVTLMDEVTHLILIHGFDFPLADEAMGERVSTRLAEVARVAGKQFVQVQTNFHEIVSAYQISGNGRTSMQAALGAGLSGIASLLSGVIGRVYIPSSATAATLAPFGSHPLVDPLWSTESLEVRHYAIEIDRYEKVRALAMYEPAWTALRPCGMVKAPHYNCGKCLKCAWTMLMLEAAGALQHFKVFPNSLEVALKAYHPRVALKPVPGHWFVAIQRAVNDLTGGGNASRKLREILRGRTLWGHLFRSRMRRSISSTLLRAIRAPGRVSARPAPPPHG